MAYLKVIAGPMFSGKTEELIRILQRSELAGKKALVLKPRLDTRTANEIASRRKPTAQSAEFQKSASYPAFPVSDAKEVYALLSEYLPSVLGIDEAQFFDYWLINLLEELLANNADKDFKIIVAGLDMDAWRRPFGIMPQLMSMADEVKKETAICFQCKERPAIFSQKLLGSEAQVEVGDNNIYEARCRACHVLP